MSPFELHIPSVFVVCSPFQALCATAAIKQFEIEDYKMVACFLKGDARNEQLKRFFSDNQIEYVSILQWRRPVSVIFNVFYRLNAIRHRVGKYRRLFIGDLRNRHLFLLGCRFVSDGSSIVYLDDGNATISILKNLIPISFYGKDEILIKTISKCRNFELSKNVCTIYSDIPNSQYCITNLDLNKLITAKQKEPLAQDGVYIIGTNIDAYCHFLKYSKDFFINKQEELILKIKNEYPNVPIIYIPHGRDVSYYAQILCQKYGCEFCKPSVMVELEILNRPNSPKAIYGFTSSALYNLKKMYPNSRVVNILFNGNENNSGYQDYLIVTDYYYKNGIEVLKEPFN